MQVVVSNVPPTVVEENKEQLIRWEFLPCCVSLLCQFLWVAFKCSLYSQQPLFSYLLLFKWPSKLAKQNWAQLAKWNEQNNDTLLSRLQHNHNKRQNDRFINASQVYTFQTEDITMLFNQFMLYHSCFVCFTIRYRKNLTNSYICPLKYCLHPNMKM